MADRFETAGAVWLGLTVGCAKCRDHKYDPIAQAEDGLFASFSLGAAVVGRLAKLVDGLEWRSWPAKRQSRCFTESGPNHSSQVES